MKKRSIHVLVTSMALASCGAPSESSVSSSSLPPRTYSITYVLDGGTNNPDNPASYRSDGGDIRLSPASKENYDFVSWTLDGVALESLSPDIGKDVTLVASYSPTHFAINYVLNGGDNNPNNPSFYTIESYPIVLGNPTKEGSAFAGWYDNALFQGSSLTRIETGSAGELTFYARWADMTYGIDYDLDGGANNPDNPFVYSFGEESQLLDPTKQGYTFEGWYNEAGEKIETIPAGTTGGIKVTAHWAPMQNNLSVISNFTSKGTVAIVEGTGISEENITVKATPADQCRFKGWFIDSDKVSDDETYTFQMPTHDVALIAHFVTIDEETWPDRHGKVPVLSEDGQYVTYGIYPQTHVSDEETIAKLDALTDANKGVNGWYQLESEYYVHTQCTYKAYSPAPGLFDDRMTAIEYDAWYWIKCEPVRWFVLDIDDQGVYFLLSEKGLEHHSYNPMKVPDHWETSELRQYMTYEFSPTVFCLGGENVLATQTFDGVEDRVFPLSIDEMCNDDYFNHIQLPEGALNKGPRTCYGTEYVRLSTVFCQRSVEYGCTAMDDPGLFEVGYWLRGNDENNDPPSHSWLYEDQLYKLSNANEDFAIRPCIRIKFDASSQGE